MKNIFFKEKFLVYAILLSAIWHIFWLSAFKVVVVPKAKKGVRFSNVSFLGPILEKGVLSVNVKAHEKTDLEKKYIASLYARPILPEKNIYRNDHVFAEPGLGLYRLRGEGLIRSEIAGAGGIDKIEPGRDII